MVWRPGDARAFNDALSDRAIGRRDIAGLVATTELLCLVAAEVIPAAAFLALLRTALLAEATSAKRGP